MAEPGTGISVIIVTRNENRNMPRCLSALSAFDDIWVVDSGSSDGTVECAASFGAKVVDFRWNGCYPKKRQWCLDALPLRHDRVFFVDADEEITPLLSAEILALDWVCAGYFVRGAYVMEGTVLRYGLYNNKLCLFDRRRFAFPVVDDLDIPGMGEIEGHYQPVPKTGQKEAQTGQLRNFLLHHALEDQYRYEERHRSYATWERGMLSRKAYPADPQRQRRVKKALFRRFFSPPIAAFLHSYLLCGGFIMGKKGLRFALLRYKYYDYVY